MGIEERVLKLLERAYSFEEIEKILKIDKKELYSILKDLQKKYLVILTNSGKYLKTKSSDYCFGTFESTPKGKSFVKTEHGIVKVNQSFIKGVNNGDFVKVHLLDYTKENGEIVEVISKNNSLYTGTVQIKDGKKYIICDDKKYQRLRISLNNNDLPMGTKVLFTLGKQHGNVNYDSNVIKVLGNVDDPDIDMICKLEQLEIPYEFSDKVLEEVEKIPTHVKEEERIDRVDYTSNLIFTIDGDDSKDFDDAVSCERLENGNYLLGVHIADVSHYVKPGSKINEEAELRGTSIYLIDRVIPMLPRKLSNGICSLNEGVDRLTLSVICEFDENGNIVDYRVEKSVINSKKRMTYNKVNQVLNGNEVDGYEEFKDTLFMMNELALKLRSKKKAAGCISFDRNEPYFLIENGEIVDIQQKERGNAEKLIEEFMIVANKIIAESAYNCGLPFIYRGHNTPNIEKIESVEKLMKDLDIDLSFSLKEHYQNPLYIQRALSLLEGSVFYNIIADRLLRSMMKAEYYPFSANHYALAVDNNRGEFYTHFTSPIRRLTDLTIHRIVKDFVIGEIYKKNENYNQVYFNYQNQVQLNANNATRTEIRAAELERYFDQKKICEYLEKFINKEFEAQISRIDERGIIVSINNLFNVRVSVGNLNNYIFNQNKTYFKTDDQEYNLGDFIFVKITSVSVKQNTIYGAIQKQKKYSKLRRDYGNN